MGSSASKSAQQAARKFPARPSQATTASVASQQPTVPRQHPLPQASFTKDAAIRADAVNPEADSLNHDFSSRLQKIGVAQPNPTFSPSSTASSSFDAQSQQVPGPSFAPSRQNATLNALQSRQRIEQEAAQEFDNMGRTNGTGRNFVNVGMLRDILAMRDRGADLKDIEKRFNVKLSTLEKLGPKGMVTYLS